MHDDNLMVWLGGLKRWGTMTMVHAALAIVADAFSHLHGAPWIEHCAGPLLEAARSWAELPSTFQARRALEAADQAEELAQKADDLTTVVGDWWSYEVVEMCGFISAAIALESGLRAPDRDIPGPPTEELAAVCRYFAVLPGQSKHQEVRIRQLVSKAIISWLLASQV